KLHVDDGGSPPAVPVTVHVAVKSEDDGAGHGHSGDVRPHGWLFETSQPPNPLDVVAFKAPGGSVDTAGLDLQTDSNGDVSFLYLPPELAGRDTVTGT